MTTLLSIAIEVMRLVPLTLAFYVPALFGMATLKERGKGYRKRAGLWFGVGFGVILAVRFLIRSGSWEQVLIALGTSLLQITAALLLAAFTVYKLGD